MFGIIIFIILLLSPSIGLAGQQNTLFPKLSYAPIVKKVAPAVVSISTLQAVTSPGTLFTNDPFFNFFFGNNGAGGQPQGTGKSLGSGVIIDQSGIVVTCAHVVNNAQKIIVKLGNNQEYEGEVVVKDLQNDLAAIRLKNIPPGVGLPAIPLETRDIEVGDFVLAIGNPFGVGQTVTNGIISAIARNVRGRLMIQTDAPINPGNSGGAIVSMDGNLVGIPNAILSKTGASHGIGFAIPDSLIEQLVASINNGGVIIRPWVGIDVQPLTSDLAATLGLLGPQGVLVANLHEGSPARTAGLAQGDVIVAVNSRVISNPDEFLYWIQAAPLNQPILLNIIRNHHGLQISFQAIQPPEIPARDQQRISQAGNLLQDLEVANLSPALISTYQLSLDTPEKGVMITDIGRNPLALELNLQKGNVIEAINGQPVQSVQQLISLLPTIQNQGTLTIRQGNRRLEIKKRA